MGPLVCPSRAAPRLFPTGRSPPTAALAPQPLPLAALSFGARPVRPMPPLRPSLAPRLLTPVRLPPGRQVRGVHQAPLRQDDASGTSTARERDATPNARCGVRFSVKTSLALQCGPAAPIHHPMMLSTTPTTMRCCCSVMPQWRQCCSLAGARRALPRAHLPFRPGHFHQSPTGLPCSSWSEHFGRP